MIKNFSFLSLLLTLLYAACAIEGGNKRQDVEWRDEDKYLDRKFTFEIVDALTGLDASHRISDLVFLDSCQYIVGNISGSEIRGRNMVLLPASVATLVSVFNDSSLYVEHLRFDVRTEIVRQIWYESQSLNDYFKNLKVDNSTAKVVGYADNLLAMQGLRFEKYPDNVVPELDFVNRSITFNLPIRKNASISSDLKNKDWVIQKKIPIRAGHITLLGRIAHNTKENIQIRLQRKNYLNFMDLKEGDKDRFVVEFKGGEQISCPAQVYYARVATAEVTKKWPSSAINANILLIKRFAQYWRENSHWQNNFGFDVYGDTRHQAFSREELDSKMALAVVEMEGWNLIKPQFAQYHSRRGVIQSGVDLKNAHGLNQDNFPKLAREGKNEQEIISTKYKNVEIKKE